MKSHDFLCLSIPPLPFFFFFFLREQGKQLQQWKKVQQGKIKFV